MTGETFLFICISRLISYIRYELNRDCRVGERGFFSFTVWLISFTIRWGISACFVILGIVLCTEKNPLSLLLILLGILVTPWFFQKLFGIKKQRKLLNLHIH